MSNSLLDQFGTANNPVGWSSTTPATVMTGPRPFRESSGSWLPGATRPLFQDELAQAKQYSLDLFDRLGMLPSGGTSKAAKMLASRRVSNLPTPPIRAYHGSPHKFDKFSSEMIGIGEGAQSYGHGLYFAGNEKVAKNYRDVLSKNTLPPEEILKKYFTPGEIVPSYGGRDKVLSFDPKTLTVVVQEVDNAGQIVGRPRTHGTMPDVTTVNRVFSQRKEIPYSPGQMYEVALHTAPNRLLDWDLPLSQQPKEILDALRTQRPLSNQITGSNADLTYSDVLGHFIGPQTSTHSLVKDPAQVEKLRKNGIDGVQYFDAGSRKSQDGTRNYAIFNDDLIEILRKYGLGGLGVGLSANPLMEQQ